MAAFLPIHHIIPQWLAGHEALSGFDINAVRNLIYLPADPELATNMGLSPHSGGHLDSYYNGVSGVLDCLKNVANPAERAGKLRDLVDSMRVALANGDLYTNGPAGVSQDEIDPKNQNFFANWKGYVDAHKDEIAAIRALEQESLRPGQPDLLKWSAIINNPSRILQL